MPLKRTSIAILATAAVVSSYQTSFSASLSAEYDVYFSRIPVGGFTTQIVVKGNSYSMTGTGKSNRIVSVIKKTKGGFSSRGTINGTSLRPELHGLTYRTGDKKGNLSMNFGDTSVTKVTATPLIKYKPGSVTVEKGLLASVIDPASALLFPVPAGQAENGNAICNRSTPIFDGKYRFDLQFRFKRASNKSTSGFSGKVFTCSVTYKPVAGHRPTSKNTKFMRANRDIEVSFARIGSSNYYGLFDFSVPIRRGVVVGSASTFSGR